MQTSSGIVDQTDRSRRKKVNDEKEQRIVLVFDVGTQSAKGMLFNQKGEMCAKRQITYDTAYISPCPDWAEQDPDYYYHVLCQISRGLKKDVPKLFDKAEACSITTMRDTSVCVDKDGNVLRPAILWLDKRKAQNNLLLPQHSKLIFKIVQMEETARLQYQKSHCNWIRENEPDIWKKTAKYLLLSGYLNYRFTGKMKDSSASLVGHIPYDYKKKKWQSSMALTRPVFPIEREKLCEIVDPGQVIGTITAQASKDSGLLEGLRLIATGSDRACELLGLGCTEKDQAAIGLGTTATISFTSERYREPERFIPPYVSVIPGCWSPEIEIFRGYWLLSWFKREFAEKECQDAGRMGVSAEVLLNKRLEEIPPGCDGLIFQPYFTPNITMPNARGAVIGFSDVHTRIHIYRAIIEGVNFALMDGMKVMEKRMGHRFREIYLAGGGSQSSEICQITADMFGLPLHRIQTHEAGGLGSAISLFVSLKEFENYTQAVRAMVKKRDSFRPNPSRHSLYNRMYQDIFCKIYGKLSGLYEKLQTIQHGK